MAGGEIILITGIMAAGKSTVAQALAERLPLSVHLRGDLFRKMIVNGRVEVSPDRFEEARAQLHLRHRLAAQAARTYAEAGFTVIYQDVILGDDLRAVLGLLDPKRHAVSAVVLAPSPAAAEERDRGRAKTGYGAWAASDLDAHLRAETPKIGLWLDTSRLTVAETVDAIVARRAEARLAAGGAP